MNNTIQDNNMMTICSSCKSNRFTELREQTLLLRLEEPYTIVQCSICALIRLHPQPALSAYEEHYADSNYYDPDAYNERIKRRQALFDFSLNQLDKFAESPNFNNRTLLDLGSAGGHFLHTAKQHNWDGIGVEISKPLAQYAEKQFGLEIHTSIASVQEKHNCVGAIHASHVLEHVNDPQAVIQELFHLLASGGIFLLEVPSQINSWTIRTKILWMKLTGHHSKYYFWTPPVDSLHHTYFYTTNTISTLLQQAGFTIQDITTYNPAYYQTSFYGHKRFLYQSVDTIAAKFNSGSIIRCIATKPN